MAERLTRGLEGCHPRCCAKLKGKLETLRFFPLPPEDRARAIEAV